jgi:class 3 adenylate cyclase
MSHIPCLRRSYASQGRSGVSDFVSGVSILFCDIKGFTTISSTIPPKTVVDMLHLLFTGFDRLTDKYQVRVCVNNALHASVFACALHHCVSCSPALRSESGDSSFHPS